MRITLVLSNEGKYNNIRMDNKKLCRILFKQHSKYRWTIRNHARYYSGSIVNVMEGCRHMKILLAAINAKYIHSNLAVYSLKANATGFRENIRIAEYTINNLPEEILKGIYKERADVLAFSCYIWNISLIKQLIVEIRKLMPGIKIWFGGPEVSYDPIECLKECSALDGIIIGEGEQAFRELTAYYVHGLDSEEADEQADKPFNSTGGLDCISGLAYRNSACVCYEGPDKDEITVTMPGKSLDMDELVFPYEDLEAFKNKIIYYESSRGCPYTCSYCLSSLDKSVRFRSIELVKAELKAFLDYGVKQVKFVDRTFNCNKRHSIEILKFIKKNDNKITNFHFEASADLFEREELELLSELRPGQVQLEIGIQTTNLDAIAAINRRMDLERLSQNVRLIGSRHNIHQHLDLIAGLPYEDFRSFIQSFNQVYHLSPNQLQLGFLKVLKGSAMEKESGRWGIAYQDAPPYEILYSRWITFDELLKLKGAAAMVETYYNSGQFIYSMKFLERYFDGPMELYLSLHDYYEEHGLDIISHGRLQKYEILMDFYNARVSQPENLRDKPNIFGEILFFDICLTESVGNRPFYAPEPLDYAHMRRIKDEFKLSRKQFAVELFNYDIFAVLSGAIPQKREILVCFDYGSRDPINNHANVINLEQAVFDGANIIEPV